jgi:hypothetical protein
MPGRDATLQSVRREQRDRIACRRGRDHGFGRHTIRGAERPCSPRRSGGQGGRYELYVPEHAQLSNSVGTPGQEQVPVAESHPIWTIAEDA